MICVRGGMCLHCAQQLDRNRIKRPFLDKLSFVIEHENNVLLFWCIYIVFVFNRTTCLYFMDINISMKLEREMITKNLYT